MRLYNRYLITCMAATLAWVLVCVVALALWLGISTHAQAQMAPQSAATSKASQNMAQNSRGPAAFPSRSLPGAAGAERTAAQTSADDFSKLTSTQEVAPAPAAKTTWWTADSAMTISACVLVFGLCVMLMSARALLRGIPAAAVLRLFGMLTIIVMSVFLIVAGYNTEQVAPVVGLLGTLAGYLVGRSASSEIADKVKATLAPVSTAATTATVAQPSTHPAA